VMFFTYYTKLSSVIEFENGARCCAMQFTVNRGPAERNGYDYPILFFMLNLILLRRHVPVEKYIIPNV